MPDPATDTLLLLAEQGGDIIVRVSRDGRVIYVSPNIRRYGYTPEEFIASAGDQIVHPQDRAQFAANVERLLRGEFDSLAPRAHRMRTAGGDWAWVEGNPRPLFDADGTPAGFINVFRDIDVRQQVSDAAQEQAELFQAAFRYAATGKIVLGLDGRILRANPSLLDTLGYQADEVIGRSDSDFAHPDEIGKFNEPYESLLSGEIPSYSLQRRYRRRDGVYIWCTLIVSMATGADGEPKYILAELQDLSIWHAAEAELKRQRAEAEEALAQLRQSEFRFQRLAEGASDIIIQTNLAGEIVFASPAIQRVLGLDFRDVLGAQIADLVAPEQRKTLMARQTRLRTSSVDETWEPAIWTVRHAHGHDVLLQGSPAPLRSEGGTIEGVVVILRDVTARTAMEEELRRKRDEAEAASQAKAQFLANMSHEIRTPLTAIIGFAGLLSARESLDPQTRPYIDKIVMGGEALLGVVNDILDFSKLDAGRIELDRQAFALEGFLRKTVDLVREQAERKGLALALKIAPDLPLGILGDEGRLRQVLLNLLMNAIKFTDRGSVQIRVAAAAPGRLRIEVMDSGVGVPDAQIGRLFQRFSQVDGSNTRRHGGAGLGLAICKGLVEAMGGEIGVDSEIECGSTFWFEIPAPAANPACAAPPPAPAQPAPAGATRILVVDDVTVNRDLVRALLGDFDVEIVEAASGLEAVDASLASRFDVILMDLQMPGMDGLDAAKAIRANSDPNRDTPILAFSANVLPEQIEAARRAGMDDHVGKPVDPAVLLPKLAEWASRRSAVQPA